MRTEALRRLNSVKTFVLACCLLTLLLDVSAYIPCKTQDECTDTYCRTLPNGAKLGNCFQGLCKCYDEYGNGEVPRNNGTKISCDKSIRDDACFKDCNMGDTRHVDNGEGYTCPNQHCYCNFELKGIVECKEDNDCGDMDMESKRCVNGGIAKCNYDKGTCECAGSPGGSIGKLSESLCKAEMFCGDLCKVFPNPSPAMEKFEGKLCFNEDDVTTQKKGICFCPVE